MPSRVGGDSVGPQRSNMAILWALPATGCLPLRLVHKHHYRDESQPLVTATPTVLRRTNFLGGDSAEDDRGQERLGSGDGTAWNLVTLSSSSVRDSLVGGVAGPVVRVVSPKASVVT